MDDAQLVVAALAGDRNAYAAIYDRYADRIHDFCASILRNRADAGDTLRETFLVAFEALDQLAEPARLRPWLYAIAHRAVLDRIERQGGPRAGDGGGDLAWDSGSSEARLSRAELAEFVWQASGALAERDRVLLDLHLRQGLEGRDLAGASGWAGPQLDERLPRLENQVERSLGALLVARTGRRSCPNLFPILEGWDGRGTAEFRARVTAHVDDCEVCNSRRRIAPSPLSLLAATPLAPAPAYLRGVVLGKAELEALEREGDGASGPTPARVGWAFTRDGFPDLSRGERPRRPAVTEGPVFASTRPTSVLAPFGAGAGGPTAYLPTVDPPEPPPRDRDRDRRGMLVGALSGLIILIAAVVVVTGNQTHTPSTVGVGVTTTTLAAAGATTLTSDTKAPPPTATTTTTTSIPSTTVATVGHLIVGGSKALDLGLTATSASLVVANDGQAAIDFTVTASGLGLTVSPMAGTLAPNGNQTLTVALDRSAAPPGTFAGSIQIASPGGNASVPIDAVVDAGPTISADMKPALVSATVCPGHPTSTTANISTITAAVTTSLPLKVVVLHWQPSVAGPGGTSTMAGTGTAFTGTLGPYPSARTVEWWITAIDNANATGTSSHQTLTVTC